MKGGTPAPDLNNNPSVTPVARHLPNGDPEKNCVANFLGRGETNGTILKDLLANSFYCVICLDEGEAKKYRIYAIFECLKQGGFLHLFY